MLRTLCKTDSMYESISLLPPQAGWTALHFAVHTAEHKVIETLLTFAINLTIKNRVGHISESKMLVSIKMSVLLCEHQRLHSSGYIFTNVYTFLYNREDGQLERWQIMKRSMEFQK